MHRIICLLLLTAGIANALKLGAGGKSRGSSAARMNSVSFRITFSFTFLNLSVVVTIIVQCYKN